MTLYPSCLFNRIKEARQHLISAREIGPNFKGYPYHIVDLSVRMRPIVEVIDKEQKKRLCIELLEFEPSKSFPKNDKYIKENKVEIIVLLGAIIHERYVHIGTQQGDEQTVRLDVISDRGRWIVKLSEFIDSLQSYILSRDEIATVVCDMIDNYRDLVRKNELEYRTKPPTIGNFDLEWLLWDYMTQELELKKAIMNQIFNIYEVPEKVINELRFSANSISYKNLALDFAPNNWRGENSEHTKRVSWGVLSNLVRGFLGNKIYSAL